MTHPFDLVLVAVLALVWPLYTTFVAYPRFKKLARAGVPGVRFSRYLITSAMQWGFAAIVVVWTLKSGRPLAWLGLVPRHAPLFAWSLGLALALIVLLALQWVMVRRSPNAQQRIRERFHELLLFLPHDGRELGAFSLLAVTAGVCEELLFRGFVIAALTPVVGGIAGAAIVAGIAFGLGHSYQGPRGVVTSTLAGAVMTLLYFGSGSLFVPMVLHAATDLIQGRMLYETLRGDGGVRVSTDATPAGTTPAPAPRR